MNTAEALEAVTDAGLFERLATAVLREAAPHCNHLVQTGVNAAGKTVAAPVDAICFVPAADPPHMIAVHHTTFSREGLKAKWLSGSRALQSSTSSSTTGDVIKTAEYVAEKRRDSPGLRATLILTTNKEPDHSLVSDLHSEGKLHQLEIDLWSRSRICHFLDNMPSGQWIRQEYLGIEQQLLSLELLQELSRRSLQLNAPPSDPQTWIRRESDMALRDIRNGVTFLVGGSGLGKSLTCYRALEAHVRQGGCGLVLRDENLVGAITLDHALRTTLSQLHPNLSATEAPTSYGSVDEPLLLVVEDVNRSGQAGRLAEKLASWSPGPPTNGADGQGRVSWRLLCPLWPTTIASMETAARERIKPLITPAAGFSDNEAEAAVLARAQAQHRKVSALEASEIARALGQDPLLVGLYDFGTPPDAAQVIEQYIEGSLSAIAADRLDYMAPDYRGALRALAVEMLERRQLSARWSRAREWTSLKGDLGKLLAQIAHRGDPIRLDGGSAEPRIAFRHDRVRDWLLADAVGELERQRQLPDSLLAEPYFAEIMGQALVRDGTNEQFLRRLSDGNPLALFHALRLTAQTGSPHRSTILKAIYDWLDRPESRSRSRRYLRWEASAILAETDLPDVPAIATKFPGRSTFAQLARLRNGDATGGVELCIDLEPGVTAPWRDSQLDHAKMHHARELTDDLCRILERHDLSGSERTGALRLAGHLAEPTLAPAIASCWNNDEERPSNLRDYLWAFAHCCGDEADRYLRRVCDAWALLSDEPSKPGFPSPRADLAADEIRWAFRRWPPVNAIDYFASRASDDALTWPILWMLNGVDHPAAVSCVAREFARIRRHREKKDESPPDLFFFEHEWRDPLARDKRSMSEPSRESLLGFWSNETEDPHLREVSFRLWAATTGPGDIAVLRNHAERDYLASRILAARLVSCHSSKVG